MELTRDVLTMRHTGAWCLVEPDPAVVPGTVREWLAGRADRDGMRPYADHLTTLLAGTCEDVAARRSAHRVGVLALPVNGRLYTGLLFLVGYQTRGRLSLADLLPLPWADAEVGTLPLAGGGTALRFRRLDARAVDEDQATPVVDTTSYWVLHPELPEAVLVTFVTAHLGLADALTASADELVATLEWRPA